MRDDEQKQDESAQERTKIRVDIVKHITTLATGTILVVVAFFDKLTGFMVGRAWLVASIVCMLVCVGAAFVYLWAESLPFPRQNDTVGLVVLSTIMYFSFLFGILVLVVFLLRNYPWSPK